MHWNGTLWAENRLLKSTKFIYSSSHRTQILLKNISPWLCEAWAWWRWSGPRQRELGEVSPAGDAASRDLQNTQLELERGRGGEMQLQWGGGCYWATGPQPPIITRPDPGPGLSDSKEKEIHHLGRFSEFQLSRVQWTSRVCVYSVISCGADTTQYMTIWASR